MNELNSILSSAIHYVNAGIKLVPVQFRSKKPIGKNWPDPENLISCPEVATEIWATESKNIGLALGANGLVSFDPDELELTKFLFKETKGYDVEQLLNSGWRVSGSPGSGRSIFRIPGGVTLDHLAFKIPAQVGKAFGLKLNSPIQGNLEKAQPALLNIFELRSGRHMDVLPPSIHPDTGKSYKSLTPIPSNILDIPELPKELLDIWTNFDVYRSEFESLLGIEVNRRESSESRHRAEADQNNREIIELAAAFSETRQHDFDSLLGRYGYEKVGKKWLAPGSASGIPGVGLSEDGKLLWSFHASDVLHDGKPHDYFDCWRILEHRGDWRAAMDGARYELGWGPTPFSALGVDNEPHELQLTDYGNAIRLQRLIPYQVRFIQETKTWLRWAEDGRWVVDEGAVWLTQKVAVVAQEMIQSAFRDGQRADAVQATVRFGMKSQNRKGIDDCLNLFSRLDCVFISAKTLDASPSIVGIDEGRSVIVLDGENGWFSRKSLPSDYVTKSLNVQRIGDSVKAVRWKRFLNEMFDGDSELINWLQQFAGYLISGSTKEQFLLFLYGSGANGKSVLIRILQTLLGHYGVNVAPETLEVKNTGGGGATEDLARLKGKRAAFTTETNTKSRFNEGLIKSLTGGDRITARPLYGHLFEFDPTHKILISGNHKPNISGTDDGIWRRIRLIPCEAQFLGDRADPGLEAKLLNELEHIAAWVLEGWDLYKISGSLSNLPKRIFDATAEYRDESDVLGEWLNERTIVKPTGVTPSNEAYADYVEWCQHQHHYPVGRRNFIDMIKRPGISNRKIKGKWSLSGLALKKNTDSGGVSF